MKNEDNMFSWYIRVLCICQVGQLATNGNRKTYTNYIVSKSMDAEAAAEEMSHLPPDEIIGENKTVFLREFAEVLDKDGNLVTAAHGRPCLKSYMIKALFKTAVQALKPIAGTESSKLKTYNAVISERTFMKPEMLIPLNIPEGLFMTDCERPCRNEWPPTTFLKSSEEVPAGTTFEFTVRVLDKKYAPVVKEWLKYGHLYGLGCWRNSGKGTFSHQILEEGPCDLLNEPV